MAKNVCKAETVRPSCFNLSQQLSTTEPLIAAFRSICWTLGTDAQPSLAVTLGSSPGDARWGPAQKTASLCAFQSLAPVRKPAWATASCLAERIYKLCSASSAGSAVMVHMGKDQRTLCCFMHRACKLYAPVQVGWCVSRPLCVRDVCLIKTKINCIFIRKKSHCFIRVYYVLEIGRVTLFRFSIFA